MAAKEGGEEVDEVDLQELQAFLLGGLPEAAAPASSASAPAAPAPAAVAKQSVDLALPPGFEDGPEASPAAAAPAKAAAAAPEAKEEPAGGNGGGAWGSWTGGGLVGEWQAEVVVEHEDPTAAYLAAKSWDEMNLPKEVLDGIFEMGFVKPSKIQEWALPIALRGGNIVGQAQNGSGKTAAFSLSMLLSSDSQRSGLQALCVCPTRELASQNYDVVSRLGKFTGLRIWLAVPQVERPPRRLDHQIMVGTPGKVQDMLKKRVADPHGCKVFVLDEADVMIDEDNQMGPQVMGIRHLLPEDLQVLLFSATWPEHVEKFAKKMVPRANTIKVQKEDLTLTTIKQTYIDVGDDQRKKTQVLMDLYGALNVGQSIIFVNTRHMAFELAKSMKDEGHAVTLICGTQKTGGEQIDISYRDKIMTQFRNGVTKVLISTDVLSRGIDVPAVTLVVNYELPNAWTRRNEPDFETYMHRIGRTGRFGLKGVAVNLVASWERPMLESIRNYYRCSISKLSGDCEEMEQLLKNLR